MRTTLGTFLITLLCIHNVYAQSNLSVVEQYIAAFNAHDVEAMLAFSAPDLKWMSVAGQDISTETSSQTELHAAMTSYFASTPDAKSSVRSIRQSGPFVYAVEEAFWTSGGIERSQCSVAVYELQDEKIQNVWYFREHRCE